MKTATPDPNIEPLRVYVEDKGPFFLHTSPEMGMKKLLCHGHERIFQVCKVYRVEESTGIHNTEFTMLEWYREGMYLDAIEEVENLVRSIAGRFQVADACKLEKQWKIYDLAELFITETGINPFAL
jgi:lysyl-tRNA synthetase class 2